jgi:hypothetical protein
MRVLSGRPRPDGWIGKNWACHQPPRRRRGDLLIFCDADVVWRPGALDAVVAEMLRQPADVFSVLSPTNSPVRSAAAPRAAHRRDSARVLPHPLLDLPVPSASTANGQLLAFRRGGVREGGRPRGGPRPDRRGSWPWPGAGRRLGLRLGPRPRRRPCARPGCTPTIRPLWPDSGRCLREAHLGSATVPSAAPRSTLGVHAAVAVVGTAASLAHTAILVCVERLLTNAKTGRRHSPRQRWCRYTRWPRCRW